MKSTTRICHASVSIRCVVGWVQGVTAVRDYTGFFSRDRSVPLHLPACVENERVGDVLFSESRNTVRSRQYDV